MTDPAVLEHDDGYALAGDDTSPRARPDTSLPGDGDASCSADVDVSSAGEVDVSAPSREVLGDGCCAWCGKPLDDLRADARFCGRKHRQSAWRFERQVERLRDADLPKRHGVADPPYPGLAWLYKDHPDFAGDHRVLLSGLQEYDGWALCTSSLALDLVVDLCRELDIPSARVDPRGYRIASWHRGPRSVRSSHPQQAWEAVVYRPARADVRDDWPADSLVHIARPRTSDPRRVIGAKPAAYASWVFGLLACRRGDSLDDLFPGSHGIARAWREATRSS